MQAQKLTELVSRKWKNQKKEISLGQAGKKNKIKRK